MSNRVVCPSHPDAQLIEDHRAGDMICSECGLVVGDRVIDVGSEWRTFSSDGGGSGEDRSRVGGPMSTLLASGDLTTLIGPVNGSDGYGNSVYNRRSVSSEERALINAFAAISNMCDRINLTKDITDRAHEMFKMVHDGHHLRGRSTEAIAAACLYISCRQEHVPRTFKEIVAVSTVGKKEIGRCFKMILRAHGPSVDTVNPGDFMNRFCESMSLSKTITKTAKHIANMALELEIVIGRSPISVAAAAIYLASQASEDKRSSKEIADIAGAATSAIRQSYHLMLPRAFELFPPGFRFHTQIEDLPSN